MSNVRRVYIYAISAITLQGVAWAAIYLLRNLLIPWLNAPIESTAFQIAVIIVALPIYLIHWLWGERLARKEDEERGALVRHIYLYGMLAGFLGSSLAQVYGLLAIFFGLSNQAALLPSNLTFSGALVFHLLPVVVLAALWAYHWMVLLGDRRIVPETGWLAVVRRVYIYGFNAVGLTLTTLAVIRFVEWIWLQFGRANLAFGGVEIALKSEVVRLIVGLATWLVFWLWAQRLYSGPEVEERESTLRKFYLYTAIFTGVLLVVSDLTALLAGLIRNILGVVGEGDIRKAIANIVGGALLWGYHYFVLRDDAATEGRDLRLAVGRQASVRRLYLYLVAGIGLAALLIGLAGDISVLLLSLDEFFGEGLKNLLAWFTAAIIAGLPVWLIPWRQVQTAGGSADERGTEERGSLARRIYLYFYIAVGTLSVLSGLVFLVYRLVAAVLGQPAPRLSELGIAIASALIGAAVLIYHSTVLRSDGKLGKAGRAGELILSRVGILVSGQTTYVQPLIGYLQKNYPTILADRIELGDVGYGAAALAESIAEQLMAADLIVLPADLLAVQKEGRESKISRILSASKAFKLVIPGPIEGWGWVGMEQASLGDLERQIHRALDQVIHGKPLKPARPANVALNILIVVIVLCMLSILLPSLLSLLIGF